jgi:hypothetical protein
VRSFFSRVAVTAACAAGLVAGLGGSAQADEIPVLEGCWGTSSTGFLCDVAVEVDYTTGAPVYTYSWYYTVCAGSCTTYQFPSAWFDTNNLPAVNSLCVVWDSREGYETRTCA